jgi:hypothetical protein
MQALLAGISNKQCNFAWKALPIFFFKKNLLIDYKFMVNFSSGTTSLENSYCYSAMNQIASANYMVRLSEN